MDIWKKNIPVERAENAKASEESQCAWSSVNNRKLVDQRGKGKEGKRL